MLCIRLLVSEGSRDSIEIFKRRCYFLKNIIFEYTFFSQL